MNITLDARLSALAALVGTCDRYADIGCDHGRLGAYLLKTGKVRRAILADISGESLKKARRLISLLGLDERVDFRVGDGAQVLDAPVDYVVIAGMGGALISRIIREGREALGNSRLILQPNVAAPELRRTLMECSYEINDERVVRDGGRNYVILAARPGEARYSERELIVGPVLLRDRPESLTPYANFRLRVTQKALRGAEKGGDAAQVTALRHEIDIWEEVLKCL